CLAVSPIIFHSETVLRREPSLAVPATGAVSSTARIPRTVPRGPGRMVNRTTVQDAIDAAGGILRLAPTWVPRTFMLPGRRLKLHPDDLYALGGDRGGINERWFSSTTNADNGPATPPDEGLSYVHLDQGKRLL